MNIREQNKAETRIKILREAKQLFIDNGFLGTTTLQIAKACEIAHGTLFVHFRNKEELIIAILEEKLLEMAKKIHRLAMESDQIEILVDKYLDYVEEDEDFLAVIAREMPFYPELMRNRIIANEIIIRHFFYSSIENGIRIGRFNTDSITDVINFIFGTVNYYLSMKKVFAPGESIIALKRRGIIENFYKLI